jgi:uncharacterized membrane protein YhhN
MRVATALALALVCTALAGHLWAEATGYRHARAALKVAASCGFVALGALSAHDRFGWLILLALCLSAVGDALLLSPAERPFMAGVGAFLLAHLAYAGAFAPGSRISAAAIGVVAAAGAGVVASLWPRLGPMRIPVLVYTAVISAMLVLGVGSGNPLVPWGALLFYLSDLTVARDRFVRPGLVNRVIGLPMYYAAQVVLAWAGRG